MAAGVHVGDALARTIEVDLARTISFLGDDARVYATPAIVSDVEYLCRDIILKGCAPGEDSVGAEVNIEHLASALLGYPVKIEAAVSGVDRRAVTFSFTVRDPLSVIARGSHRRFVLGVEDLRRRIDRKRGDLQAGAARQ